jgi:hypothetical protein
MRNLLEDVFIIENLRVLNEGKGGGPMVIEGTFQRADEENNNKRIYPKSLLEREMKKLGPAIAERRLMGELDHPQHDSIKLNNVSHLITNLRLENKEVVGRAEILNTPAGKVAKALIEGGVKVGISSRGLGTLSEDENGKRIVNEDFQLVTWDLVADPSTRGAFPGLTESTEIQEIIDHTLPDAQKLKNFSTVLRNKLDEYNPSKLKYNAVSNTASKHPGSEKQQQGHEGKLKAQRKAVKQSFGKDNAMQKAASGRHGPTMKQVARTGNKAGNRAVGGGDELSKKEATELATYLRDRLSENDPKKTPLTGNASSRAANSEYNARMKKSSARRPTPKTAKASRKQLGKEIGDAMRASRRAGARAAGGGDSLSKKKTEAIDPTPYTSQTTRNDSKKSSMGKASRQAAVDKKRPNRSRYDDVMDAVAKAKAKRAEKHEAKHLEPTPYDHPLTISDLVAAKYKKKKNEAKTPISYTRPKKPGLGDPNAKDRPKPTFSKDANSRRPTGKKAPSVRDKYKKMWEK